MIPSISFGQSSLYSPEIEQRVDEIMAGLTLEDKIGQMTQFAIDVLSAGDPYSLDEPHTLVAERINHVLGELRTGSILNVGGHAYTREHWFEIIHAIQDKALETNGIPVLYGIDAIHGTNYTLGATLYPQQIGLAATWNPVLVKKLGEITAYETRASSIPWNFSPVLDIGRDPRWSRFWEGFGEDPHLATRMGIAMVLGYQGSDISAPTSVAACLKHYMGYSLPVTGKDRTQAWIPERQLREYVMPPFKAAIEAGAYTIMVNSGEINGIPAHANDWLLKDLLRDEMGFEGVVVTDWEDIGYLVTRHRTATDYKDAIRQAINAGIDMAMVPMDLSYPVLLKELVEEGKVPMSRIDESARRVIALKVKLGLFELQMTEFDAYPLFGSEEHAEWAYRGAAESITLLKNENNVLPLKIGTRALVTGPTANSLNYLNGGWTWTWQGDQAQYHPEGKHTILEALTAKLGQASVTYVEGASVNEEIDIQAAVDAAANVDVIIACIGEATYTEKPGDIPSLDLPEAQRDLVKALAATGKPVVLVLVEGRPRIINDITGLADGILMSYLPGLEGGRAVADILVGEINPSGKLPFTYPSAANSLIPYDHRGTDRIDINSGTDGFTPEFEFGHGLSYTTFVYSNLKINKTELRSGETITIEVDVKNTGTRPGMEVVQLYTRDHVASITPSVKRLRAFEKMELATGETKTATFVLNTRDLAFVGKDNEWVTEAGAFSVMVGGLEVEFEVVE